MIDCLNLNYALPLFLNSFYLEYTLAECAHIGIAIAIKALKKKKNCVVSGACAFMVILDISLRQTANAKRKISTQEQGEAIADFSKRSFTPETVNCLFMWSMSGDDVESPIRTLAQVLRLIHSFWEICIAFQNHH